MIKQYRKKSRIVEAVQWTGDNFDEIKKFAPDIKKDAESGILILPLTFIPQTEEIDRWSAYYFIYLTDYLVRNINCGWHVYPVKQSEFDNEFEELE